MTKRTIPAFYGRNFQQGYGIGNFLKSAIKGFTPVLKSGLMQLGKNMLETGAEKLSNMDEKKKSLPSESLKTINNYRKLKFKSVNQGRRSVKVKTFFHKK